MKAVKLFNLNSIMLDSKPYLAFSFNDLLRCICLENSAFSDNSFSTALANKAEPAKKLTF